MKTALTNHGLGMHGTKEVLLNRVSKERILSSLDWLTQEITDSNIKLNALSKETDDLKLSIVTSQEITGNKCKEINNKLKNDKADYVFEIDEL